jgi:2-polyprenyl-3-methyl-5-hydroxy-6-metoxy-1,4-benzoquinol methylase
VSRNAGWDAYPAQYDEKRSCWLNERRIAFVARSLEEVPASSHVVELGSGTGWLLLRLAELRPDLRFSGIEPLDSYVAYSQARARSAGVTDRVRFVLGTAERADRLVQEPGHVVLSNDVLHHVERVDAAARAAASLASPEARWLAIEPNPANPYVFVRHAVLRGERPFDAKTFLGCAEAAGWQLVDRRRLFLVPPQIKRAPRWAQDLERRFEHLSLLAGGLALELRMRERASQ